jgi:hypothetical protein
MARSRPAPATPLESLFNQAFVKSAVFTSTEGLLSRFEPLRILRSRPMIPICILLLSVAAMIQFGISQWRAVWLTVAARPLSDCLQAATGLDTKAIRPEDFYLITKTSHYVSPAPRERNVWLREVGVYFHIVSTVEKLVGSRIPAVGQWTRSELLFCAKYAAAVLDQRLNANLAYAADMSRI